MCLQPPHHQKKKVACTTLDCKDQERGHDFPKENQHCLQKKELMLQAATTEPISRWLSIFLSRSSIAGRKNGRP